MYIKDTRSVCLLTLTLCLSVKAHKMAASPLPQVQQAKKSKAGFFPTKKKKIYFAKFVPRKSRASSAVSACGWNVQQGV